MSCETMSSEQGRAAHEGVGGLHQAELQVITLHVIADSISMHYGPYLKQYLSPWVAYSRKEGDILGVVNPEGVNGQDSPMVLAYLERCISVSAHWDVALLNCGLWDIRDRSGVRQTELESYGRNVSQILVRARQIADSVVWIRTSPVDDERHNSLKSDYLRHNADVVRYNAVADRLAHEASIPIIDLFGFTTAVGLEGRVLDHVHYTDDMRKLQAAFIAGELASLLSLPEV